MIEDTYAIMTSEPGGIEDVTMKEGKLSKTAEPGKIRIFGNRYHFWGKNG